MRRIDTKTGLFVAEDPTTSSEGTVVTAEWCNALQEEVAHVIEAAGITLDAASTVQLLAAIKALTITTQGGSASGQIAVVTAVAVALASGAGYLRLGDESRLNLIADLCSIQARNNGASAQLDLNPLGGLTKSGQLAVEAVVGAAVALASGAGYLRIGAESGPNLIADLNSLQARRNGAIGELNLNPLGGVVRVNGEGVLTADKIVESQGAAAALARLPCGTIVQCVQTATINGDTQAQITWPIAFPTACVAAVATDRSGAINVGDDANAWSVIPTVTGAAVYNDGVAASFSVIAMGY